MSQTSESNDERPCLHCLIGDLIDDFYGEFGSLAGKPDTIDTNELLSALAKTFAELEQVSLGLNRGDSQRLVIERVCPH